MKSTDRGKLRSASEALVRARPGGKVFWGSVLEIPEVQWALLSGHQHICSAEAQHSALAVFALDSGHWGSPACPHCCTGRCLPDGGLGLRNEETSSVSGVLNGLRPVGSPVAKKFQLRGERSPVELAPTWDEIQKGLWSRAHSGSLYCDVVPLACPQTQAVMEQEASRMKHWFFGPNKMHSGSRELPDLSETDVPTDEPRAASVWSVLGVIHWVRTEDMPSGSPWNVLSPAHLHDSCQMIDPRPTRRELVALNDQREQGQE